MLRIILLIILILMAIPFFNEAKDYIKKQSKKLEKTEQKALIETFDKDKKSEDGNEWQ